MEKRLSVIMEKIVLEKNFKIYGTYENPLFLAKEVSTWLDYSNGNVSKLVNLVDEEECSYKLCIFYEGRLL